jgi:hypothetical protein
MTSGIIQNFSNKHPSNHTSKQRAWNARFSSVSCSSVWQTHTAHSRKNLKVLHVQELKTFPTTMPHSIYQNVELLTLFQLMYEDEVFDKQEQHSLRKIGKHSMSRISNVYRKTCINKYIKRKSQTFCTRFNHQSHRIESVPENEFPQHNTLACIVSETFIT